MGVDYRGFAERAAEPEVADRVAALRQAFQGRRLILGVDHMDRTSGLPEKLRAFAHALERHPGLREQVTLVQVVVPAARTCLVTPLQEGMNLVAKEYCAANLYERGVLVLSEFAGAAAQLAAGALIVNPHNTPPSGWHCACSLPDLTLPGDLRAGERSFYK